MEFDINKFIYAYDEGDEELLFSIAYLYQYYLEHVDENDYNLIELLLNVIIDRIYDMPGRDTQNDCLWVVQDEYFQVLDYGISGYSSVCDNVYRCADRLADKIGKVPMSYWELAETLRIIGGTEDRRYYSLMEKYKDHEDAYVREVVEEYYYDLSMEEDRCKRIQEKGDDLEVSDLIEEFFDVMVDRFFAVKDRKIKEDYFKSLRYSIANNIGKGYDILYKKCIDQLADKIKKVLVSSWELAEILQVIGCTRDKRYWGIMEQYKDHEDVYVREVVQDYFYETRKKEGEVCRANKGNEV